MNILSINDITLIKFLAVFIKSEVVTNVGKNTALFVEEICIATLF